MEDPDREYSVNQSKSYAVFFCKTAFVAFVIVIVILFPSQAPEFIHPSILTKPWEFFHLLFIGISISYGLFGRKNAEINSGIQSHFDNSPTYLFGVLPISSFDNGYEDPCRHEEKRMTQYRNLRSFENGHENSYGGFVDKIIVQTCKSQLLESEWEKPRSLYFQNDLEFPLFDEKKASKTGYCQYFHGESTVFASRENSFLGEWDEKPKCEIDYKPLGLPVRSLKSSIVDHDIPECIKGNGFSPDSKGSYKNSCKLGKGKFRGLTPINLDQEFKGTLSLPSRIRWGSRSNGSGVIEDKSTSTFQSASESQSHHLKSECFWSSIFSQTSFLPSPTSPKEILDPKEEDLERKGEASWVTTKTQGFSFGSMSEMNEQRNCDEKLKGFSKSTREDPLSRGNWGVESWKTEGNPKSPAKKTYPRDKSVRTMRERENDFEGPKKENIYSHHVEDEVRKKINCDMFEPRQNLHDFPLKQSSKLSKHQKGEMQEFAETTEVESGKESERECAKFQVSSEEEKAQSEGANAAELDPNEVDKKAGEFIAKFREQIRLQKIASINGFGDW